MLKRVLCVLCSSVLGATLAPSSDPMLPNLLITLQRIDTLTGYGPPADMQGLDRYLAYVEKTLQKKELTGEELERVQIIVEHLFARYPYRDGSRRSRIYAAAQQELAALLSATSHGQKILSGLAKCNPLVALYVELYTT